MEFVVNTSLLFSQQILNSLTNSAVLFLPHNQSTFSSVTHHVVHTTTLHKVTCRDYNICFYTDSASITLYTPYAEGILVQPQIQRLCFSAECYSKQTPHSLYNVPLHRTQTKSQSVFIFPANHMFQLTSCEPKSVFLILMSAIHSEFLND